MVTLAIKQLKVPGGQVSGKWYVRLVDFPMILLVLQCSRCLKLLKRSLVVVTKTVEVMCCLQTCIVSKNKEALWGGADG